MAADPRLTNAAASVMCDALVDSFDSGGPALLRIYDGTIPTTADTAIGAQVLLAELTFNATAFGAASNGVATAAAITSDSSANATGTATWGSIVSGGGTRIVDFTVGTSGEDLNLNTTSIVAAATVSVTSMTITMPKT